LREPREVAIFREAKKPAGGNLLEQSKGSTSQKKKKGHPGGKGVKRVVAGARGQKNGPHKPSKCRKGS